MPAYVRLRSLTTGHQWDASTIAAAAYLATGGVTTARPARQASRPRPAKHLTDLAGRPARPRQRRQHQPKRSER